MLAVSFTSLDTDTDTVRSTKEKIVNKSSDSNVSIS